MTRLAAAVSRMWTQVRTPAKLSPGARSGHAGLRAGAHFYIFGGEVNGHPTNELWRFHFGKAAGEAANGRPRRPRIRIDRDDHVSATETWDRIVQSLRWPLPRVDCSALLVPGAGGRARQKLVPAAQAPRAEPPAGFMREISKLSSFRLRRAARPARCSYSVLGERDSTESLAREAPAPALPKSRSSFALARPRQPPAGDVEPREADEAERELAREPISVPDFADMVLPAPALSAAEAARLVYFDSEEEEELRRRSPERLRKSASVRFSCDAATASTTEDELSTSDYASAERVNRASAAGFSNPHYLGPDVRGLGAALTPDSGVVGLAPGDIELLELPRPRAPAPDQQLHLLLVGGKEAAHPLLLQRPLSLWTYRLL